MSPCSYRIREISFDLEKRFPQLFVICFFGQKLKKSKHELVFPVDCSHSPTFPQDRRDRALCVTGGHLHSNFQGAIITPLVGLI